MKTLLSSLVCAVMCFTPMINSSNYQVTFIRDGYFGLIPADKPFETQIIKSKAELDRYIESIIKEFNKPGLLSQIPASVKEEIKSSYSRFNKKFFEKRNLIFAHIDSGSGSVRYELSDIYLKSDTLSVTVNRISPLFCTMDYRQWFMLLELDKTVEFENVKITLTHVST